MKEFNFDNISITNKTCDVNKEYLSCSTPEGLNIFRMVKEIPAADVARQFGVDMHKKGGRWLALCPLHDDKNPSFSLYRERFKCFGCNWSGDAVDLVAKLLNLQPLDAAREIARSFGLDDGQGRTINRGELLKFKRERREKQEIEAAFAEWRKRTFYGLSMLIRACDHVLEGDPELPGYAAACHLQPKLEYLHEVLNGPEKDQVEFFDSIGWEYVI